MSKQHIDIYDIAPSIEDILKENQQLRIDLKNTSNKIIQLEKLVWKKVEELVNEEHRSKELYDKNIELKQENQELKQAIKILKLVIEMPMENDIDYVDSKGNNLYKLRIKRLLGEEAYDLLKEVFESVGRE